MNEAIDKDDPNSITKVESLCYQCGKNGISKFLLTDVPHFKETVVSAFECPHCGYRNSEIIAARALSDFGVKYTLAVLSEADLNRQVVKCDDASICIPEAELEIPSMSGSQASQGPEPKWTLGAKSTLNTVEGLVCRMMEDLSYLQPSRKTEAPEAHQKIDAIISKLHLMLSLEHPFTFVMDDPSGNSYIETLSQGEEISEALHDTQLKIERYTRTKEQLESMGFSSEPAQAAIERDKEPDEENKIYEFSGKCPSCQLPCMTRMHPIDIPYFKEVIIMATVCDNCGYKSNEVKSGALISPMGRKITLSVERTEDLSRDVLKSETSSIEIPEIGLFLHEGSLGGKFTTLEGLLDQVKTELVDKVPFAMGDSATLQKRSVFKTLIENIEKVMNAELPCRLVMNDPLANSYIQNLCAPDPDPQLKTEDYERTWEQNEDLGINDMVA